MAPPSLTKSALLGCSSALLPTDATTVPRHSITLHGRTFLADNQPFLTEVPANIIATTPHAFLPNKSKPNKSATVGCFVGLEADVAKSRHVFPIGKLNGIRFMSIFRFKVWWTTHWVGTRGSDVEHETQMMLLENSDSGGSRPYVLLLPIIEGAFRASLQSGENDDFIDLCVESGSEKVLGKDFRSVLYMHAGENPFELVKEAMKAVRGHLGSFRLLEEKSVPGIVEKFGWCTWDAFYLRVHPQGVWEGVRGLAEGGCPPGLVLIDDGWQSICHDEDDPNDGQEGMNRTSAGEQMPCRLIKFEENHKFRDYRSVKSVEGTENKGLGAFVKDLKEEFRTVEHVYVWHALCGYWGGIRPGEKGMMVESRVVQPKLSEGLKTTMEDLAVDKIVNNGVGLVPPEMVHKMYDMLHSHLAASGIDGVKVDVIHLLEMLAEEYGGRVELAKAYYKALTASVRKHFKGNGVIASMEHCNDFMLLGTEAISLGRVGDDFWCTDPAGDPNGLFWLQGCHMVHCAYNSLWMGNFIQPDWDMFQSTHPCAAFHAASRAISGGPIYVSDSVGKHDFDLLKSVVLPDGSILRCQSYALPTRDCLFEDPLHDGKTMLKIWNLNKFTGVLGAFNCQGGGWCRESRRNKSFPQCSHIVSCTLTPKDIEWNSTSASIPTKGVGIYAMYTFKDKKLHLLKPSDSIHLSLNSFDFELITVSLVTLLTKKPIQFAPLGLTNMLNTGGAIQTLTYNFDNSLVKIGVRGSGEMRVYASEKPSTCRIDGNEVEFKYEDCMVVVQVPWPSSAKSSLVEFLF